VYYQYTCHCHTHQHSIFDKLPLCQGLRNPSIKLLISVSGVYMSVCKLQNCPEGLFTVLKEKSKNMSTSALVLCASYFQGAPFPHLSSSLELCSKRWSLVEIIVMLHDLFLITKFLGWWSDSSSRTPA
jgi:hypothetical protein